MLKKTIKTIGCLSLTMGFLFGSVDADALTIQASDVKITLVKDQENSNFWTCYYFAYAQGYVQASAYHYANAEIQEMITQEKLRSGRRWGYGKVSATTPRTETSVNGGITFSAKIYYGTK